MVAISVLMPVYNCERYLPLAIDSVIGQRGGELDIVVVDNCSTDRTFEVARRYLTSDGRLRVFRNEFNIGSVANAGRCLELAKNRYAMFMSGDDVLQQGVVERFGALADGPERPGMVFGGYVPFVGEGSPDLVEIAHRTPRILSWPENFEFLSRGGNPVPFSGTLFDVEIARAVAGFRTGLSFTADYLLWLRLASEATTLFVPEVAVYYRIHETSDTAVLRKRYRQRNRLEVTLAKLQAFAAMSEKNQAELWRYCRATMVKNCVRGVFHSLRAYAEDPARADEARTLALRAGRSDWVKLAGIFTAPAWALAQVVIRPGAGGEPG